MTFKDTEIAGAYLIGLNRFEDERGFFARAYCKNEFLEKEISFTPVQANIGYTQKRNTIRGLHYQLKPHAEAKLVRCIKGIIYDVIIDLRPDSPTYKKWAGIELKADDYTLFYLPEGCAHGYQTLRDDTEIFYMASSFYAPEYERGIRWDDPNFNIQWKEKEKVILSDKDRSWPDFSDA